ncbi:MAG: crossover junction endodeoxyribonuclease RuvC [Alphaproteobacteria bacterium]|nr:MAG: crossover junction endodeoxyribonuclease RuvC [Alphaproteobacteria bacterium]
MTTETIRVLGIDPGLVKTGFGVIEKKNNQSRWIAHGVLKTKIKDPLPIRLTSLHQQMSAVIEEHKPHILCIEEIFMNNNPQSTLKLGMARGVLIMLASVFNMPFFEYRPNYIKKTVTGSGHADKEQIMKMVELLLSPQEPITQDSSDALAVALCYI